MVFNLYKPLLSETKTHPGYTQHFLFLIFTLKAVVDADLLSSVDDVLCERQAVDAGPARHRVVARWRVSHLHGTELQEGFAQSHPAEQQVPRRDKKGRQEVVCALQTSE